MFKKLTLIYVMAPLLVGCATVPMANKTMSNQAKLFTRPGDGNAGLYVYRDSGVAQATKRDIFVDGHCLGQSAPNVFFYEQVPGNQKHTISTESEFSPNQVVLYMKAGVNYFVRQYIKLGVFVSGANVEVVSPDTGESAISDLGMAVNGQCSK